MSQIMLTAQTGRATGSPASRRLRAEEQIPGVIYGQGMSPISLSVNRRELRLALNNPAGMNTLLSLAVDGKKYPAIIKQIQRHPIRRTVSHIDFFQVNLKEDVTISVPVRLDGEAKAVVSEGGLVDPSMDSIEVTCTPGNMPNEIVIDITEMQPGDVIRLGDVTLPAGVIATGDADTPVVTTMMPHAGQAGDSVEEAGEAAEGDAAAE
jgi:large subunit ribosomal protein L25